MHSAFISSRLRYRAMPLAGQLVHKRSVHPGPLVLGTTPFNSPAPTPDRDRTVSRRSEPSSRTALIGEQPNPWDLLQPQANYPSGRVSPPVTGGGLERQNSQGSISLLPPPQPKPGVHRLLPMLRRLFRYS